MRLPVEAPGYRPVPTESKPSPERVTPGASAKASFSQVLRGLGGAVDRGEGLIRRASGGNLGGLDSGQLIALQAGIYRYSEAVDLLAKLVDRASNAVRSVISPH